jgi:VAD1 Analog of StAR-related lipid transfer domain
MESMIDWADDLDNDWPPQLEHFETSLAEAMPFKDEVATTTSTVDTEVATSSKKSRCFRRRASTTNIVDIPTPTTTIPLQVLVDYHVASAPLPSLHRRVCSTGNLPNPNVTDSLARDLPCPPLTTDRQDFDLDAQLALVAEGSSKDDDSSVGSTTYFDASDFDSTTWTSVINNASTVGLVIMALATAVTHPLLFLAGAVTALGTANAAYRGCNYCTGTVAPLEKDDATMATSWREWFGFDVHTLGNADGDMQNDNGPLVVPSTILMSSDKLLLPANDDATAHGNAAETEEATEVGTFVGQILPIDADNSGLYANPTVKPKHLAPEKQEAWLLQHFPPLKNTALKLGGPLVGLSVVDFFHVFFDDDAPYSFRTFQEKRGDMDIKYGTWEPLATVGPISMFSPWNGAFEFPRDVKHRFFHGRRLTFKAKTNSFFGPQYATTTKMQRFLIINKRLAVLENKTILHDIPYSDRFFVMERWFVTAEKMNGRYVTHVTISCEASFTQSCPFEHQIKAKSTSTISDIVASWCTMAKEAIKLTELAKCNRLKRNLDDDEESEAEFQHGETKRDATSETLVSDEVEVVADASFQIEPFPTGELHSTTTTTANVIVSAPSMPPQVSETTPQRTTSSRLLKRLGREATTPSSTVQC